MPAADRDRTKPVFHRRGDTLVPTELARGPWYEGAQHGSAMIGALARAIEQHPVAYPAQVTRLTVDMMRAAPCAPITTTVTIVKDGKSIQLLEAVLQVGGETFARASALKTRVDAVDLGASAPPARGAPPVLPTEPSGPPGDSFESGEERFHHTLELRAPVEGIGAALWVRMANPLVDGEALTPFVRTAVAADWTYAVPTLSQVFAGTYVDRGELATINPDACLYLHRPMSGEWLHLDAHVHYGPVGAGSAVALLSDCTGPVGHTAQSILIRAPE